jgi:hypothetical protein
MYRMHVKKLSSRLRKSISVRSCGICAVLGMVAMTAGCGGGPAAPPLGTVTGTITLDGEPVEGMSVIFTPSDSRSSTGMTDKDGNYDLDFDNTHKGAAIGMHKVHIALRLEADPAMLAAGGAAGPPKKIPTRYNDQTTLERDVKAGENTFDFELTSGP